MNLLSLILISSLAISAHAAKAVDQTLATVGAETIFLTDYEANAKNVLDDFRKAASQELTAAQVKELRQKVLDQMVDDLVLYQEAKKQNVKVYDKDIKNGMDEIKERFSRDESGKLLSKDDAENAFQIELKRQRLTDKDFEERIRRQLMVIKLVDQNVKAKVMANPPVEKDVEAFFKKVQAAMISSDSVKGAAAKELNALSAEEKDELYKLAQLMKDRTAERVRARHILIKTPPGAKMAEKSKALGQITKIKKEIDDGLDFPEAARRHSEDTESAKKGGDLGYFIKGWMVPSFEKAAFSSTVGQVVGPVESEFGYHLILVEEKRAGISLRFEEVKDDLGNYLAQRNFQKNLKEFVVKLRADTKVTVKENLLNEGLESMTKEDGSSKKENKDKL